MGTRLSVSKTGHTARASYVHPSFYAILLRVLESSIVVSIMRFVHGFKICRMPALTFIPVPPSEVQPTGRLPDAPPTTGGDRVRETA